MGIRYQLETSSRGADSQKKPPILFVHGGGLLIGSPETRRFDLLAKKIASQGHPVFSMRYPMLWEGLTHEQGTRAFHCAAQALAPEGSLRVVSISAGSWLSLRALQTQLPPDDPCRRHGEVTHFAAISPMIRPNEAWGPTWIARWYEGAFRVPEYRASDINAAIFMIHGQDDWLVPARTTAEFCSSGVETRTDPSRSCTRLTVPGGHFIVRDGKAGSEESTQALLQFLSSSSN